MVDDIHFESERAAFTREDMHAEIGLRSEIYGRRIAGGHVVQREKNAAGRGEIGRYLLPVREIPLPDCGLDACAVDSAVRRKHDVRGHYVHSPFEIAAQNSGQVFAGKDPAAAPSGDQKLRVVGFAETVAAAPEDAEFPGTAREGG